MHVTLTPNESYSSWSARSNAETGAFGSSTTLPPWPVSVARSVTGAEPVTVICCVSRLNVSWPLTTTAKRPPVASTVSVWTLLTAGATPAITSRSVAVRTSTVTFGSLLTSVFAGSSGTHWI